MCRQCGKRTDPVQYRAYYQITLGVDSPFITESSERILAQSASGN